MRDTTTVPLGCPSIMLGYAVLLIHKFRDRRRGRRIKKAEKRPKEGKRKKEKKKKRKKEKRKQKETV